MSSSRRRTRAATLLSTGLVAATALALPTAVQAEPGQDGPTTQRDEIGPGPAEPGDPQLRSTSATDVVTSLEERTSEVEDQVASVLAAREEAASVARDLEAADAAVSETEDLITQLTEQGDSVVIESFMNPPAENALETLAADSLADATVKQSILTSQSNANADVLTELQAAEEELVELKAAQQDAADVADEKAAEADAALADLVATQSAESLFVVAVQDRLASRLAEAEAVERVDPAAADEIRAREAEIAAKIDEMVGERERRAAQAALEEAMAQAAAEAEAAEQAASSSAGASLGPASGNLTSVSCPGGGSITVDSSLAGNLRSMLDAAAADGLNLCGGGYRDPAEQIALRQSNCGTSNYAIYEAPSSYCSPPTARPGTSNHEQGLAIDFTCNGGGTLGSSSPCFAWLQSNAADYGLYNLPSEPWHWSNDGT